MFRRQFIQLDSTLECGHAQSSRVDSRLAHAPSDLSGEGFHLRHLCRWTRYLARQRERDCLQPVDVSRRESLVVFDPNESSEETIRKFIAEMGFSVVGSHSA